MKGILIVTLLICSILSTVPVIASGSAEEKKKAEAIMAAENFLLLIDTGQYGQSWDEASALFRKQVSKQEWIRQVKAIRTSLGPLVRREIVNAEHVTELPGAPDGDYVVIRYESSFDRKQKGVETVAPMLDEDGKWRVSGYYIK